MAIGIDNSLINARTYAMEVNLADSKKVKFGDYSSDTTVMAGKMTEDLVQGLDEKQLSGVSIILDKTIPELREPKYTQSGDIKSEQLQTLAKELEKVLDDSSEIKLAGDSKTALQSDYVKINENVFAALYAKLLELFAALNVASTSLTALNAGLAEKLAVSAGDNLISAAQAQKNQAIVSAVTSMSIGGAGLALSVKGINQQQKALKQSNISNELNSVNNSLNNSITNGSNVANQVPGTSGERVGQSILNNNSVMSSTNHMESELLRLAGQKNHTTGNIVGNMGTGMGGVVSSGYTVQSATDNAASQVDNVAKDNMVEAETKNRESQTTARNALKALLDLIYQSIEKNNDAVSHTAQMIKA